MKTQLRYEHKDMIEIFEESCFKDKTVGIMFNVIDEEWDLTGDKPIRKIKRIQLLEVSLSNMEKTEIR